jgi:uncharacterized protein
MAKMSLFTGTIRFIAVLGMLIALGIATAHAASFDCHRASTAREKIVCSDAELSKADEKLADLYDKAQRKLSPDGAKQLRGGQRDWLHFLGKICPLNSSSDQQDVGDGRSCLRRFYAERNADLQQAAVQRGPYLFSSVDHYGISRMPETENRAGMSERGDEGDPMLSVHHIAYPRIDQPVTAQTDQWNRLAKRDGSGQLCGFEADCATGECDTSIGYTISLANARLVSVRWVRWGYCRGTAHGDSETTNETSIFSTRLRALVPSDLFRSKSGWTTRLGQLAIAAALSGQRDVAGFNRDTLADVATHTERWSLQPDGLVIRVNPYELECGYTCVLNIVIRWSDLRSIMVPDPPVP